MCDSTTAVQTDNELQVWKKTISVKHFISAVTARKVFASMTTMSYYGLKDGRTGKALNGNSPSHDYKLQDVE